MNDAFVTFQGWVGGEITYRETGNGDVANFRVGSTPRVKRNGDWTDGKTSWFAVSCWRSLGRNVRDSIKKGDAVVVHGRLRADVWERADGTSSTTYVVEATFVGHDLTRGTSTFLKSIRPDRTEPEDDVEVKEMLHAQTLDGPQLDSYGNPRPPLGESSAA
jgi:single-strand DNA-binding protein